MGDTAYSGKENLTELKSQNIQAIVPLNPIVHNGGVKQEGFEYNKDADCVICPRVSFSKLLKIIARKTNISYPLLQQTFRGIPMLLGIIIGRYVAMQDSRGQFY